MKDDGYSAGWVDMSQSRNSCLALHSEALLLKNKRKEKKRVKEGAFFAGLYFYCSDLKKQRKIFIVESFLWVLVSAHMLYPI